MKKAKCMAEGDVIETETAQGRNENIGDDVRARAMAAVAAGMKDETEMAKPKKKKAKAKSNAATESHSRMNAMGDTYAKGGKVSQLSKANGCAIRGKTRGRIV